MELYLVQHGEAKTEAEDPQRGLTEPGRRKVEKMAAHLRSLGFSVDRVEHSDKLRARQTAEIFAAALQPRHGTSQVAGLAPNDDVEPMRVRLQKESNNLMLVGHLPHLSRLVSRLLELEANRTVVRFQMGGVVRLDREDAGQWLVRWLFVPELLPD